MDWWELLRGLDDPEHMEFPADYDHSETRARFDLLVEELDKAFTCRCRADRQVQDASHHGDVLVPAAHTAGGEQIIIRVSNFGDLAVYSPGNLGQYLDAEKPLPAEDRRRVEGALNELGYRMVPEDLLHARYDGRSPLARYYPPEHPPTWFVRFFDYL
ncbi:hypothetical protein J4573_40465 [Actinomadura barringtoniae]|uniref:Uncharacterized protein n=1 Tax=Actinomadura barringtoniae TaxID=1427535 RepID=A0A939PNP4_9ACTN|nr:hypothetical protein [Actinomadura barringtoniae]MBO2453423.1 hypothetical protein [Actinomadura barringtoniae]